MKKVAYLVMLGLMITLVSCGGEEAVSEAESAAESISQESEGLMDNLMEQGLDQVINEVTEQIGDTSSAMHDMMDTLKNVIDSNEELIEDKLNEGLDALNKAL